MAILNSMTYEEFLNKVIDNGIAAAKEDYKNDKDRRDGSVAGFEACRDKQPNELLEIYQESVEYAYGSYFERDSSKYWWFRCYQLEVEWVCNVVSALLYNEGKEPILSWLPTCNGVICANNILISKIAE